MGITHFSGPIALGAGSVVSASGSAQTLTAEDNGKTFFLDSAAGATITLPALKAGIKLKFVVSTAFITTNWVIDSLEGDNISGNLVVAGEHVDSTSDDQINFVASLESLGDFVEFTADYANSQWIVYGVAATAGGVTSTDPS